MSAPAEIAPDPGLRRALGFSTGGTAAARCLGAVGGVLVGALARACRARRARRAGRRGDCDRDGWRPVDSSSGPTREVARSRRSTPSAPCSRGTCSSSLSWSRRVCLVLTPVAGRPRRRRCRRHGGNGRRRDSQRGPEPDGARGAERRPSDGCRRDARTAAAARAYVVARRSCSPTDHASVTLVLIATDARQRAVDRGRPRRHPPHARCDGAGTTHRGAHREALAFGIPGGLAELVLLAMLRSTSCSSQPSCRCRMSGCTSCGGADRSSSGCCPTGSLRSCCRQRHVFPNTDRTRRLLRLVLGATALAGVVLSLVARPVIDLVFGAAFGDAADGGAAARGGEHRRRRLEDPRRRRRRVRTHDAEADECDRRPGRHGCRRPRRRADPGHRGRGAGLGRRVCSRGRVHGPLVGDGGANGRVLVARSIPEEPSDEPSTAACARDLQRPGRSPALRRSVRSIYEHVDGITVITTHDRDWQGRPCRRRRAGRSRALARARSRAQDRARSRQRDERSGKVATEPWIWPRPVASIAARPRAALGGRACIVTPDYFLIIDADEIYEGAALERLKEYAWPAPAALLPSRLRAVLQALELPDRRARMARWRWCAPIGAFRTCVCAR